MQDQDEIYEAATEEPATLGCPSLVPGTVVVHDEPGGMDGAMGTSRPTPDGRAACPHAAVHVEPDYEMLARELTRDGFEMQKGHRIDPIYDNRQTIVINFGLVGKGFDVCFPFRKTP